MKRISLIIMGVLLCLTLFSACGGKQTELPKNDDDDKKTDVKDKEDEFVLRFFYDGIDVTPGVVFDKNKISEKAKYTQLDSCAFDDYDRVYTYANVEITTSILAGEEVVYSVYFLNDKVATLEGVRIADDSEVMLEKYGEPEDIFGYEHTYIFGEIQLNFMVENEVITSIEYIYLIEE